jgi:hypothetical protein
MAIRSELGPLASQADRVSDVKGVVQTWLDPRDKCDNSSSCSSVHIPMTGYAFDRSCFKTPAWVAQLTAEWTAIAVVFVQD